MRATGTWKDQSGAIELAGHDVVAGAELLKAMSVPLDGCATAGRYRFEVNGTQLRLSVIGDACAPRLMFLDKTRWAPPGEPNLAPPRTVTRTMFDAAVRLPRAADRSGSWPSFRGPQAAGFADEQQLPDRWNVETGENILWRTSIPGLGHSSPIVWGDRSFVTSAISSRAGATFKTGPYNGADASDDTSSHQWVLYALDAASGRIVWQKTAYEGLTPRQASCEIHLRELDSGDGRPGRRRLVRVPGAPRLHRRGHAVVESGPRPRERRGGGSRDDRVGTGELTGDLGRPGDPPGGHA